MLIQEGMAEFCSVAKQELATWKKQFQDYRDEYIGFGNMAGAFPIDMNLAP